MPKQTPWRLSETIEFPGGSTITYCHNFKTTKDVAEYVGCSPSTLTRWSKGESKCKRFNRYKIEPIEPDQTKVTNSESSDSGMSLTENATPGAGFITTRTCSGSD
jgi:hypothetical protein